MYPVFSSKPIGTGGREPNMTTSKRERGGRENQRHEGWHVQLVYMHCRVHHLEALECTLTGRLICCYLAMCMRPTLGIYITYTYSRGSCVPYALYSPHPHDSTPLVQYCISHTALTAWYICNLLHCQHKLYSQRNGGGRATCVAQLSAGYVCLSGSKKVITHSPPLSIDVDLQSTRRVGGTCT